MWRRRGSGRDRRTHDETGIWTCKLDGGRERSYVRRHGESGASPMISNVSGSRGYERVRRSLPPSPRELLSTRARVFVPRFLPSSLPRVLACSRDEYQRRSRRYSGRTVAHDRPQRIRLLSPYSDSAKLGNATGTHEVLRCERAHRSPLHRRRPSSAPLRSPEPPHYFRRLTGSFRPVRPFPTTRRHTDRSILNTQERKRGRQTWPRQR